LRCSLPNTSIIISSSSKWRQNWWRQLHAH
jgi:hypothetical protein